jgi:hypothetical protein
MLVQTAAYALWGLVGAAGHVHWEYHQAASSPCHATHTFDRAPPHTHVIVPPQEVFGTTDEGKICLEILAKGELQVGWGGVGW